MQHSNSNDDTCFNIEVIDEVTKEELDALLQDSDTFMSTSEKINETDLDLKLVEFIEVKFEEMPEEEIVDNCEDLPLDAKLRIKTFIQDPPTDLEMKLLHAHLEYAYLEEDFLLLVIIASDFKADEKERLVSVLKNHKEAFAWKTSDILDFDIKIKNKKGEENVAADHLSHLEKTNMEELREDDIDDNFLDETLMRIENDNEEIPWFADFANYLVANTLRKGLAYAQCCKFFLDLKHNFWEEPYLFKMCPDGMIRRCVHDSETQNILDECHHGSTVGHYDPSTTAKKVFDGGFYWPTIFKKSRTLVQNCDACQRSSSPSR
ncbi:reverse transcriptase domain-containing protein [Tanacetum coccineum]